MKAYLLGILSFFLIFVTFFYFNGSLHNASDSEIPPAGAPSLHLNQTLLHIHGESQMAHDEKI